MWVRRFFELAGAISFLGSVGGATVLAILIPAVTGAVLGLPTYLLIVLGIGVFFVALAVILAILKVVLERRSSKGTQQPTGTPNASNRIYIKRWQDLDQEKEELRTKLQESEQEREELTADKAALQKELASRGDAGKSWGATVTQEDPAPVIARLTSERDKLREELESRKADAGLKGKFAYDQTEKVKALEEEKERLQATLDEGAKAHRNRLGLLNLLGERHEAGLSLSHRDHGRRVNDEWEKRTSELIKAALVL